MDPFEVRIQFTALLSKLTSSLTSIHKVAAFAIKHSQRCADDIWDCLVEECDTVSLNARINMFYFLDTLLDQQGTNGQIRPYAHLVKRDLAKLVEMVVPPTREGILNLMAANQVLRSWKTRRLLEADILDPVISNLERRRSSSDASNDIEDSTADAFTSFSRNDILRRIEDDRERHKRLRERIWVLPVPTSLFPPPSRLLATPSTRTSPASPASPSDATSPTFAPSRSLVTPLHKSIHSKPVPSSTAAAAATVIPTGLHSKQRGAELAIEIEFEQIWEAQEEEEAQTRRRRRSMRAKQQGEGEEEEEDETTMEMDVYPLTDEERIAMRRERHRCYYEDVDT